MEKLQKLCKIRLEKLQNKQKVDGKNKIRGDMMINREMKTTINNWILQGSVENKDQKIYMPIYMIMFLKNTELENTIYKIDLSGL